MNELRYSDHAISPPALGFPDAEAPSALDEYLFDLRGYLLLEGLLGADEVAEGNRLIDAMPRDLPRGGWHGWVQREDHPEHRGTSWQQVYELGGVFERMLDHPRLLNLLDRFVGGHETHDRYHGPLAIDENFFNLRGPGEAIPVHAGGHEIASRTGYRYHNGRFLCGEINVLTAFTDIGPGAAGQRLSLRIGMEPHALRPSTLTQGARPPQPDRARDRSAPRPAAPARRGGALVGARR
ncbi:MAG: hypothetical protein LC648_08295 [Novosphingobium sp.]|nr:hypothetical protein [Novosphingobium sp.]